MHAPINEKVLYSPSNAAHALDVSRTTIYELMKHGLISFVPYGADRRIPAEEIKRLATEGIPGVPQKKQGVA